MAPDVSVVISTCNRRASLDQTLESILGQTSPPSFELIVVDNCSTDGTRELIASYQSRTECVRYVFEGRQGVSYGRNAGIAAARAALIAFTDDDVLVATNWLAAMKQAFHQHPECGCVGGKVEAIWPEQPPLWLTRREWAALALLDYGDEQAMDANNRKCLITANMGVRRSVFDEVGMFCPDVQRTPWVDCAVEDRELQERYWRAGGRCWFDPRIAVYADVQPFRLKKGYHRRWHRSHGEMQAILRDPEFESSAFRVFDIPGHVLRRAAGEGCKLVYRLSLLQQDKAFEHELEALFFLGFIQKRLGQARQNRAAARTGDSGQTRNKETSKNKYISMN